MKARIRGMKDYGMGKKEEEGRKEGKMNERIKEGLPIKIK